MRYAVIVQFAKAEKYYVEADSQEEATDQAYEMAVNTDQGLLCDSVDVIDCWEE